MCFYHGDAWHADVYEDGHEVATKRLRCDECRKPILPGERHRHVFLLEREECRDCCRHWTDDKPEEEGCECSFGESYECDICEACDKVLTAIKRVEEEDGCKGEETQPGLGQLLEALWESDHGSEYVERARRDFPELAWSGRLDLYHAKTRSYGDDRVRADPLTEWDELGGEG